MKGLVRSIQMLAWTALIGAVVQELRKPDEEREWHGNVLGFVPYDFRIPSAEKLRDAYWAPERDELFSDAVFGVGWAVNVPVAARRIAATVGPLLDRRRHDNGTPGDDPA